MAKEVTVTKSVTVIATAQVKASKQRTIQVKVGTTVIGVPVSEEIFAYCNEQILSKNSTPLQKKRRKTFLNALRAAYEKGLVDGKKP